MPPPPGLSDNPEHMQHWLRAKAEDDRRSQEEEKTRQEALKLEQRKIEQAILADALRAGVPPDVLPLLFASMKGNGVLPQDMAQQWTGSGASQIRAASRSPSSHIQAALPVPGISTTLPPLAQHLQTAPAGPRRDLRATNPTLYSSSTSNKPSGTGNIPTHLPHSQFGTAGVLKPVDRARAIDVPTQGQTTPSFPPTPRASVSQQQQQQQQTAAIRDEPTSRSSPSISFHHWVPPPAPASVSTDGQVSSGRKRKSSYPHHHHAPPPRSFDTPAGATLDDRNGSIGESQVSPRSQRRLDLRDLSSSYESGEGEYPTPAELHAGAALNRKELQRCEGIKQEQEHEQEHERISHREAQGRPLSTSDIENISTPGGTAGFDRP